MRVEARKTLKVDDILVEMGDRLHIMAWCWGHNYGGSFCLVEDKQGRVFLIDPKMLDISVR